MQENTIMTTRTVKMLGLAYGPTPAEIEITFDGNTIYTGTVSTTDSPLPSLPNSELTPTTIEFCQFEIPMEFSGTKPMSCTVNNGTVIFAQIVANYCAIANSDPFIGTGPDVYLPTDGIVDSRSNVAINGVAQVVNHEELPGTWWFTVPTGSTLTYDLDVIAGTANVAPPPPAPV
jgi:hypothetical protein